jgi:hypothetical protein
LREQISDKFAKVTPRPQITSPKGRFSLSDSAT